MGQPRNIAHSTEDLLLKIASDHAIDAVGGSTKAARICEGSRQQRLSDCANRFTPDFLRIDEVGKLEDATAGKPGWPIVTRALAARQNCILFHAPPIEITAADYHSALAQASLEYGEANGLMIEALRDGKLTLREVREKKIVENIDDVVEQLLHLRALALAAPEEGEI